MRVFLGVIAILLFTAFPVLLGYESPNARIVGRYSTSYAAFLLLYTSACLVIGLLAALPRGAASSVYPAFTAKLRELFGNGWVCGAAIALAWAMAITIPTLLLHVDHFGRSLALHVLGLAALIWTTFGLLLITRKDRRSAVRLGSRYLFLLVFASVSWVLLEAGLRMGIGVLPGTVVDALPSKGEPFFPFYEFDTDEITVAYRYKPGIRFHHEMKVSEAGLYVGQRHLVRPTDPQHDRVLSAASFTSDELGYRNGSPLLDSYPVIASGDSFTAFAVKPRPWPTLLAEGLGAPVLNLGMQGYGPQSAAETLIRFGLPRQPRWVVLSYYEGNDLLDSQRYEQKKSSGMGWAEHDCAQLGVLGRFLSFHLLRHGTKLVFAQPAAAPSKPQDYPYPFTATFGGRPVELAFMGSYLTLLSMPREEIEKLSSFHAVVRALSRLKAECDRAGARLLVAYCPTKEHCYLPLLPRELAAAKLGEARRYVPSGDGSFAFNRDRGPALSLGDLLTHMAAQHDAVLAALSREGVEVIDLTPPLRAAAESGREPYWTLDNHWSPEGDEIAAREIQRRIEARGR